MPSIIALTDEPILGKGLSAIMAGLPEFDLVGVCGEPRQLVNLVVCAHPDLLLIDLTPDVTLELISELRQRAPQCKVVLWVRSIPVELAYQTMRLGIHGIFRKTLPSSLLIRCLQKVSQGDHWFEETLTTELSETRAVQLSRRESQLISLLAQGAKNKEIAYALSISEGTIKVYLSRLFRKVGVKDRYELALYGLKNEMCQLTGDFSKVPVVDASAPAVAPTPVVFRSLHQRSA